MYLLLIPVVAIVLDTLLRAFKAREGNPIVDGVRSVADRFILDPFTDVFPDQSYLQTAAVALAAYGILTLLVVALFRGLRSLVASASGPNKGKPPPQPERRPKAKSDSGDTSSKSSDAAAAPEDEAQTKSS